MSAVSICSRCVLPASFPGISFDEDGVCNHCREGEAKHADSFYERERKKFDEAIASKKGKYAYDAVACYSGGKDSSFMLKWMVEEHGLNVLAFTLDNGFITEQSKSNIIKVVDVLQVDHVFFKPSRDFMTRMYRQSIFGDLNAPRGNYNTRISDVCLSCISVVNTYASRLALQNRAPMIFAGFTPGQIPRAVIKNNHRFYRETYAMHETHFRDNLGEEAQRYLDLPEDEFEIYQMSPFLVYEKSEEDILNEIRELGWEHPEHLDGCTSNCALNVIGNMCHEKKYGFHPYALELSKLIRKNLLSREEALEKLSLRVEDKVMEQTLGELGVTREEVEKIEPVAKA